MLKAARYKKYIYVEFNLYEVLIHKNIQHCISGSGRWADQDEVSGTSGYGA